MTDSRLHLFNFGEFKLHAGATSNFKIDCDALSDADLEALAAMIAPKLPPFFAAVGVPRGGVRLANIMQRYGNQYRGHTLLTPRVLIVDDVYTTGASMRAAHDQQAGPSHGLVIFARAKPPDWITAIFTMTERRGGA